MTKNYLKGTAGFMIALILTLPIYSSSVMAVLSNGHISGADNARGYYRRNENVYINITAWISGDTEIAPSQLHLNDLHGATFNSCTGIGGGSFNCIYQMHSSSITQSPHQQRIALYNDNDIFNSLFIIYGAFDEEAPEIKSFTITPFNIGSGNANLNYNIYDHSYSPTDVNKCSGIKKLEFSYDGAIFKTVEINSQPNQCSVSDTVSIPANEIGEIEEGTIEIILTAYDSFSQESSAAAQFDYDPQPAIIDDTSLEIKDNYGNDIEYIGNAPVNGVITFIVESDDLNIHDVYGDLSDINPAAGYNNRKAACTPLSYGYECSFNNIEIKLTQSTAVNIIIRAADLVGNIEPVTLTKNIIYDAVGPSATSIKTDKVDNDISYAGTSTTFIAILNEDGIGINKDDIKLDLSNIKSGLSSKPADECASSVSQWTCYWYDINTDQSEGEKTVSLSGTDKLGNAITGTLSAAITLDKTAPIVVSSDVTPIGAGVEAFANHIKTGDTLDVTLNIKEKNQISAYADFSSFITTQDNLPGSCSKQGEDWICSWSSSKIDVPGHIINDIAFNVADLAGNSVEHQKSIEVLYYEDAPDISYWTSDIACSPELVDRQVTNLVNTRVYCSIALNPITPDQETLSINLGSCTDKLENSLGYIEKIELINAETGSVEPYLAINLIKGEMTIDKLSITCPLQIISRVGTKINKNPEIELVDIDINFYNNPLGEFGQGIQSKIDDAKDDAFGGIWKFVGFLEKIVSYSKLICNSLAAMQKIKLIFKIFTEEVTTAHIAMIGTPVAPILAAEKTQSCLTDETLGEVSKNSYLFLNKFCKFVNCQTSPKPPDSDKGGEAKKESTFGNIVSSITQGHWFDAWIDENAMTSQDWNTLGTSKLTGGEGATGTFEEVFGKQYYQYANSRDNLLVAIATGCIPGIINGLNKYRQILCLYADCLEQNAYNNVPVKICEDQKSYATCKYLTGEIFAVLPWTAFFDYYMGMVRGAFSDPLTAIVTAYNILDKTCIPICTPDETASIQWLDNELTCRSLQFLSLLGEVINDVQGMIDSYDQIKNDYCKRLDDDDKDED